MKMTIETISYDIQANTASVRGVGKILQDDSTGLMLARRTAITDAQRGLLLLRRSIIEGKSPRPDSVSGNVPPFSILSEDTKEGLYFVYIEAVLSDLVDAENIQDNEGKIHEAGDKKRPFIRARRRYHDENRKDNFLPHINSVN